MNLHEYQGKQLLADNGVEIQRGIPVDTVDEAVEAAKTLTKQTGTEWWVVKAQIHAGGRGKGGGVKLAKSLDELETISDEILGMQLVTPQTGPEGKRVNKLLITEDAYVPGEHEPSEIYMSVLMDRSKKCNVIVYSPEGGVDIESVAEETPDKIFKEFIDPELGLQHFQARKIAFNLGLEGDAYKNMVKFVSKLYGAFIKNDASMFEINPVLKTADNRIIAVDSKVSLDDNALYRHKDLAEMRDETEEDPTEVEAGKYGLSYVNLDGNVGCMVNGAGLAMATMDMIKLSGGEPANFLDVGGTANAETVEAGFRIITEDPKVEAILVNIFGGIVRCDRVANGVIEAYNNIDDFDIPVIVRLQGTNAEKAKEIIENSDINVKSAVVLKEAADLVKQVLAEK